MSIWTFSRVSVGFVLGLSLSACSMGGEAIGLFQQQEDVGASEKPRRNVALRSAEMARGTISLSPPAGYCIDKRSLKQTFAVVARCDSLGGKGGAQDAPLGMVLVSLAPATAGTDLSAVQNGLLGDSDGVQVLDREERDGVLLMQLSGTTPEAADPIYWRGVAQIGPQLVSLLALAPEGGAFRGPEGGEVIRAIVNDTRDSSVAVDAARNVDGEQAKRNGGLGGLLSGLFD